MTNAPRIIQKKQTPKLKQVRPAVRRTAKRVAKISHQPTPTTRLARTAKTSSTASGWAPKMVKASVLLSAKKALSIPKTSHTLA